MTKKTEYRQIPIMDATLAQLRQFAVLACGYESDDVDAIRKPVELIAMIRKTYDKDTIRVMDMEPVLPRSTSSYKAVAKTSDLDPETKVVVNIPVEKGEGGARDVAVGVNGKNFLIPRGQDKVIKYKHLHILENALQYDYPSSDNGLPAPTHVHTYPFTYKGLAADLGMDDAAIG